MRLLRVLSVLLAGLVAAAALAAWLAPRYLDWNRYRDQVTRLAASVLDRPVLIEGPITLRLLPEPVLTATRVRIAGEPNQGSLSAGQLSLSLGLAPLLSGRLDARDLVLRKVDLRLPWPLPEGAFPARQPAWLAGATARIEDGRLAIGTVAVSHVSARLAAAGANGGFSLSGTGEVYGHAWRLVADVGAAGPDNTAPLRLVLDGEGDLFGTEASFSGEVSPGGMGGRVTARGPDLAQLLPTPKVAFSADGRLTVASGLAAADNLALSIGGAPAQGAVSLRTTPALRLDLALKASRLDLDAWLPVLLHTHGLAYPVGIDLSAEAAPLAGGLVRQLRAATEIDLGTVAIHDVSAILPGEATLRLSGRITDRDAPDLRDPPHGAGLGRFAGKAALAAPDLRATLEWLTDEKRGRSSVVPIPSSTLQALPASVLRSLDVSADVALDADRLALSGLAGTLDGSRFGGDVSLGLGLLRGEPAPVHASLRTDRLDLDPWMAAGPPLPSALAHGGLGRLLRTLDVDLQLKAARANVDGIAVGNLVLDGAASGGRLAVRRFEARALGLQANASGSIDVSGRIHHARLAFTTRDATPIGDWLAPLWRATPAFWRAPLLAWVEADGPAGAVKVDARMLLANADFGMSARLDWPGRGTAAFNVDHPDASLLLRQAGFADLATAFGAGPLAARLRVGLAPDRIDLAGIQLAAGEFRASGALSVDRSGEEPRVSGHLTADTLPLPRFGPHSPSPLPLGALRGWQALVQVGARRVVFGASGTARTPLLEQATGSLSVNQGTLQLEDVQARFLGGSLSGALGLKAGTEAPVLALKGKLSGARIAGPLSEPPLDLAAAEADADIDLTAAGYSPATLLATMDGRMRVALRNGELSGFDLSALDAALRPAASHSDVYSALRAALASGRRTAFDRLDLTATASRGILQLGKSELAGPDGGATLSGSIDLPDSTVDLHLDIRPRVPNPPAIGLTITGPANAPRHLPDLADVTRWRNQIAHAP